MSVLHALRKAPPARGACAGPPAGRALPAVVGALWLDAAALGALVDHLSRLQLQALHVLFSGVSFRYCPLQFDNNAFGLSTKVKKSQ